MRNLSYALRYVVLEIFKFPYILVTRFYNTIVVRPGIRTLYCRFLLAIPTIDKKYSHACSKSNIESYMIRQRVKLAKKRHDKEFLYNINNKNSSPEKIQTNLKTLFPPRRKWVHLGKNDRANKSPIERNNTALVYTINKQRNESKNYPYWLIEFDKKRDEIMRSCLSLFIKKIESPELIPIFKKTVKSQNLYRPLARFDFESNARISRCAAYFRERLDHLFENSSFAFRGKRDDLGRCPTHHDAVQELIDYRKKFVNQTLYVAECDIKKFFDIINHEIISSSLNSLRKDLIHKGCDLDFRSIKTFNRYLKSYNYNIAINKSSEYFASKRISNASLDSPAISDLSKIYATPKKEIYGVPQGGALSPIIANIVLHAADKAIWENYDGRKEDLLYIRYCDDMIISHPNKDVCQKLFDSYCKALEELKLIVHEPELFSRYDKTFYSIKSKSPYPWTSPTKDRSTVPWVSFCGYQVNWEGLIRIRQESLNKEKDKQKKIVQDTIGSIKKKNNISNKSKHQILHRVRCKLYSMAVGKKYLNIASNDDLGLCWTSGFKLLKQNDFEKHQIRQLDYSREYQLSLLKKKLSEHEVSSESVLSGNEPHAYYGYPFSYSSAFENEE